MAAELDLADIVVDNSVFERPRLVRRNRVDT